MRVALLRVAVPFVRGGAEVLAEHLAQALATAGHEVEDLAIPDYGYGAAENLVDAIMSARLLRFNGFGPGRIDRLITLKFPAYHAQFDRKSVWLLHPWRQAYELWAESGFAEAPAGRQMRNLVQDADLAAFGEAEVFRALSRTVADRLRHFLSFAGEVLYCPPPTTELLRREDDDGYLYFPSRLSPVKRHRLALHALAATRTPVRLVVSGAEDVPGYAAELALEAERLGIGERVVWRGYVDDAERARLFARCRAVVFAPFQEDYGFVTLEAMASGKPVVTTRDAGGPTELVRHEETGFVVDPEPASLAAAIDRLWTDPAWGSELGRAGQRAYAELGISWDRVVSTLVP